MKKLIIEPIDNVEIFFKFLEKYKCFRELQEQYKSTKFCKLYMKIYNYMLNIPKEKIVISHIKRNYAISEYINYMFYFVKRFLEAKDFYNWKDRIYKLMTIKLASASYKKYELLYRSNIKFYINQVTETRKNTCLEKYNVENVFQIEEIRKKQRNTLLNMYGVRNACLLSKHNYSHSKLGDEFCLVIDNALGNPKDSYYAIKNREFFLKTKDDHIRKYDYCVPSLGIIIEFDGIYWHALDKNPDDILVFHHKKILAKEIWQDDKEKEELAIQNGYKVFHVKEDEYKKDPKGTIEKLLVQINNHENFRRYQNNY